MSTDVLVKPPVLIPWLTTQEKSKCVVLLDVEVDTLDGGFFRFDLDVVFNQISVRRNGIQQVDYYIGTTGAEILTEFFEGTIRNYTEDSTLTVNYVNKTTRTQNSKISMIPEIIFKTKKEEIDMKVGTLSWEAGIQRSFTTTFASEERILTPIHMGNLLRWVLSLPRGEKAIRDFLIGNLHLYVECGWECEPCIGRIDLRPSDIRFFDHDRRPIGKMASISMLYALWKQGIKVQNKNGINATVMVKR